MLNARARAALGIRAAAPADDELDENCCPFCGAVGIVSPTDMTKHAKKHRLADRRNVVAPHSKHFEKIGWCTFQQCNVVCIFGQSFDSHCGKHWRGEGQLERGDKSNFLYLSEFLLANAAPRAQILAQDAIEPQVNENVDFNFNYVPNLIGWAQPNAEAAVEVELEMEEARPEVEEEQVDEAEEELVNANAQGVPVPVDDDEAIVVAGWILPHGFNGNQLVELEKFFNKGFYRIHHTWVNPLRELSTQLLIAMREELQPVKQRLHSLAFFMLGGMMRAFQVLKRPKPLVFLRGALVGGVNRTEYVINMAWSNYANVMRQLANDRVQTEYNTLSTRKRKYKRSIERLFSDGRLSTATTLLDEAARSLDVERAAAAPITNAVMRTELRRLNPLRDEEKDGFEFVVPIPPPANPPPVPPAPDPDGFHAPAAPTALVITHEVVREVIKELPKGSANGPSGWTCGVIHRLYAGDSGPLRPHHEALAKLFTKIASGCVSSEFWVNSRAVLIPKDSGGYRPLGIGETWYRILGRCILKVVGSNVGSQLAPYQLGCGIRGGCEIAARLSQIFLDTDPNHVLVKTDFKNAFNLTPRRKIHEGLVRYCPLLLPWFQWAYGGTTLLVNSKGEGVGTSETGCRQGDPLAALMFCVAIHGAILEINEWLQDAYAQRSNGVIPPFETGPGKIVAYMDDCTITVSRDLAPGLCQAIEEICNRVGLVLNIGKCRLLGPALNLIGEDVILPFGRKPDGETVLGNPVGTVEFRIAECRRMVEEATKCLPMIKTLEISPSVAFSLVKQCINMRVSYLTRVMDTLALQQLKLFDELIDGVLRQIAQHFPEEEVIPSAVEGADPVNQLGLFAALRSLPIAEGGLGVHRHSWIAGQVGCIKSRIMLKDFLADQEYFEEYRGWVGPVVDVGTSGCPLPLGEAEGDVIEDEEADSNLFFGEGGSEALNRAAKDQFLSAAGLITSYIRNHIDVARAAMFISSSFTGSGRWLTPQPGFGVPPHLSLDEKEYIVAFRQRLLLDPLEGRMAVENTQFHCNCGAPLDYHTPFHLGDCPLGKYYTLKRHDVCRRVVRAFLQNRVPEMRFVNEPLVHVAREGGGRVRRRERGDLMLILPISERQIIVDFAVCNPAARTYTNIAAGATRSACRAREDGKILEYAETLEAIRGDFVPFAVEVTGRIGERAARLILDIVSNPLYITLRAEEAFRRTCPLIRLQSNLCTAIAKVNAQMVRERLRLVTQREPTEEAHVVGVLA